MSAWSSQQRAQDGANGPPWLVILCCCPCGPQKLCQVVGKGTGTSLGRAELSPCDIKSVPKWILNIRLSPCYKQYMEISPQQFRSCFQTPLIPPISCFCMAGWDSVSHGQDSATTAAQIGLLRLQTQLLNSLRGG